MEVLLDQDRFMAPSVFLPEGEETVAENDDFYKRFTKDYYYDNGIKVYVLDEAVVKRQQPKRFYSFYDAVADYSMDSTELASLKQLDIRNVLMRFPGIDAFSGDSVTRFGRTVKILVDDFEEDWDFVLRLRPEELLNISLVIPPRSKVIDRGADGGVLVITTNPFYTPGKLPKPNMLTFSLLGYQKPAEFYVPHYEVDSIRRVLADSVDLRSTVYWNPDVTTDKHGKAVIEFYNNSTCREIQVSAEGLTPDGRCIFNE